MQFFLQKFFFFFVNLKSRTLELKNNFQLFMMETNNSAPEKEVAIEN